MNTTLLAGEELTFAPTVENGEHATCLWTLDGAEVSREATYTFLAGNEAYTHTLSLQVSNEAGKDEKTARLNVISQGSTVTLEAQTYTVVPIELNGTPLGGGTWKVTSAASDLYRLTGGRYRYPLVHCRSRRTLHPHRRERRKQDTCSCQRKGAVRKADLQYCLRA